MMSKPGKEFKDVVPFEKYSEAFKRQVVKDYETGLYTMAMLKRKYGIPGHSTIGRWLRKYSSLSYGTYLSKGRPMKNKDHQRIKELEAALEKKEAELDAFKKFINIAERELKIKIVKKSGTKQSKK
jgi:transposase